MSESRHRNHPCERAAPGAISYSGAELRDPVWQAQSASHTSRRTRIAERFWVPNDLCCRRWHPGQIPGVLRIASSVLHILSQTTVAPDEDASEALVIGRKAAQERFSEESFRSRLHLQLYFTGNAFLKLHHEFSRNSAELTAHSKPGLTRGT
jgi:hypothetical protein